MDLPALVDAALQRHRARRAMVGFSGGADSLALLHAAAQVSRDVLAVHVHHGLSEHADAWTARCRELASRIGVPFEVRRVAVADGNLEASARVARFDAFASILDDGDALLLAHHAGDGSETLLMRLFSGRGVLPIPAARPLGGAMVLRPWLHVDQRALMRYLTAAGFGPGDWIEDPANADPGFDRNWLRHTLLPEIRRHWPDVDRALQRVAGEARARQDLLTALVGDGERLPFDKLAHVGDPGLRVALRVWLESRGEGGLGDAQLDEFVRQARAGSGLPELRLPSGDRLCFWRGAAHRVAPPPELARRYVVTASGRVALPHGWLEFAPGDERVEVRFRAGGERLHGRSLTVKTALQRAAVAPWLRPVYPLVFHDGRLVSIPGIAAARGMRDWRVRWNFH